MNLTELARILKVSPQELKDKLPLLGFDIGQKAIKVDNPTAQRIIREWPKLIRELEEKQRREKIKAVEEKGETQAAGKEIKIPKFITVREFADLANLPVSKVLSELMKSGTFVSMNEKIDFDTAAIIGADLGLEISPAESETGKDELEFEGEKSKLKKILEEEKEENLQPRPPVIVVMGHVDHGKTKLLDAIRRTDVVAGEAGGITQHIGAYQVEKKGKSITFIDTPGHEAFTAMRSRGAKVADIAILVVAADDGVKPQTVEAFNIIKASQIPFIVAINKIDKPEADINKTKQELSNQLNITPEDWGGKTISVPVSAKTGAGLEDLLDMVLLTADIEAKNMKANPLSKAVGTVVESHIDKGEGAVATILIQNGTLKVGDQLSFNNLSYGKVRALKNYRGESINEACPSTPVKIIGLKAAPQVGDILEVGEGEKVKIKNMRSTFRKLAVAEKEEQKESKIKKIHLIIKSDVLGSAEAIEESLQKASTEEVKVEIIHKGLGNITEGNINQAEASNAQIIGFHVKASPQIAELAREKNITIKIYDIIYDLINDIKKQIEALTEVELRRVDLGKLKVAAIFRTEPKGQIVGGRVIEGKIETDSLIEIIRDKEIIGQGKLIKLQSGKQDVKSVEINQECGIEYGGKPLVKAGDILQFYKNEKVKKI
jgi:translation initiation factor IF-2